jgi:tape measure domain-containing protein
MSNDAADFELDLHGNTADVAKKMAAEVRRLRSEFDQLRAASARVDRAFARSRAFTPQQWGNIQNHANAIVRLQKSHRQLAPASAAASRALRTFGVSGGFLRKFSIDAAKSEIALRRLYRLKGGGVKGAMAVGEMVTRRSGIRGKAASALGRGALGAAGMLGSAGLVAGGATAAGAGILGWNMAETAIEAERVKFALNAITNGQGAQWWATSSEYAKRFGLNVNMVADNLMNLKASGFEDDMAKTLFLRMGDLRSLGATEETIGRALLAIRQVQAAGRLQGDELNQLSEAGINANFVYAELSKTLHKTVPEIVKMKEAGKLTSDIVIPAIANAIGAKTGGKAAGAAGEAAAQGTVIGQWGRLKGAFSVASTQAIGSDALAPLRTSIADFTDWISGDGGSKAIGAFGGTMTRIFEAAPRIIEGVIWFLDTGLPAAWDAFSTAFGESGGTTAWNALLGGAETLGGPGGAAVISTITDMASAAGNLAGALVSLLNILTPVISGLITVSKYTAFGVPTLIGKVSGWLSGSEGEPAPSAQLSPANDNGTTATPGTIAASAQAANDGFSIGSSMALGMQQGMTYGAPGVSAAAMLLGQTANQSLKTEEKVHSPGRKMMAIGAYEAQGYALGMEQGIPRIEDVSRSMGGSATSGANASGNGVGSGAAGVNVTVQIILDGHEVQGKTGNELVDLMSERLETKLASVFGRLAYNAA